MKLLKKLSMILSVLLIFAGVLSGCSNQNEVNLEELEKEVSKEIKGDIVFWHGWSGAEEETLKEVIKLFQDKYPEAKVNPVPVVFEQLQDKLKASMQAGEAPDLFLGPNDWVGVFATLNQIEPLDAYLADVKDNYIESGLEAGTYEGMLYALPESIESPVLIYNADLIKEAPKTTDELIKLAVEHTNEAEGKYGFVMDISNFYFNKGFFAGFGANIFTDENANIGFETEPTVKYLNFLNTLRNEKKVIPKEIDYNVMMSLFTEGKAAMMINGPWSFGDLDKSGINWRAANYPVISETNKEAEPFMGGKMLFLPKAAKNKEGAVEFMKFMTSPEISKIFAEKAGHVPANKNVDLGDNWKIKAIQDQVKFAKPIPSIPEMAQVWEPAQIMVDEVLSGKQTPQVAVENARNTIINKIKEMRGK
ncbi:arabinogalactan oligomer / maltooligosaccharide transport system substrate-binding protein [Alkalithermobacter thermoalcaliphilus JW-YL-7 = DSM 7308]|uniref:Maltodextrin-binding protein n=1 Tax=Alkalithermobacter thermoalcaliphilus JW-YL-7 = DSM 7308 TaxID=1121328 RepID=A0A150FTZ3_CLOPD|nr:putative ABC transporter substrate binding protein [[Clostridium] paradoxum JW-YL-7 = DSM 7308]SHL20313.1 arabinogalactan oligomer / maltooligosaccharide transport system substrate-binding protein [[Clostridium] paradoxum JW-YL-7 = DSM 7308]